MDFRFGTPSPERKKKKPALPAGFAHGVVGWEAERLPFKPALLRLFGGSGAPLSQSDRRFAVQLDHFTPGFLSYSEAAFLKWQSDTTLGAPLLAALAGAPRPALAARPSWSALRELDLSGANSPGP